MSGSYYCQRCESEHSLTEIVGMQHLRYSMSKEEFGQYLAFTATAGSYAFVTDNTEQYVRDVEVFRVLKSKFSNSGMFESPEAAQNWLEEHLANNPDSEGIPNAVLYRLQGDGAGEVDAMRQFNGSLKGVFQRAEFIRDADGSIPSNTPGVDLRITNRITGDIVEEVQVKSGWSVKEAAHRKTVSAFRDSSTYDPSTVFAAPKEAVEQAEDMGLPNRLMSVGDVKSNKESGKRLAGLIEDGAEAVEGRFTVMGVAEQAAQGALVGAVVTASIASIGAFLAMKRGEISKVEAAKIVGVEASRGAVVGTVLSGAAVFFPPGAVGIGVGVVVGMQVRRIVDIAYGKGAFAELVKSMDAIEASIEITSSGIALIEESTRFTAQAQLTTVQSLMDSKALSDDTDSMLAQLRRSREGRNDS